MAKENQRTPRRSVGNRINGRVARISAKVDKFKTPLGLAVLAVAAFLGYVAFKATTGPPFLPTYKITVKVPADAPSLRKGEAVRVGGSLAGLITKVTPDPANHRTLVEVNISKTGFRPLPVDTTAFVRVHSIVYLTFLALTPGSSKKNLKDGDTLAAPAQSGTDLLEVVELFDKKARDNLSKTLINVGYGAAGRGTGLNAALKDLPSTASYLNSELKAATSTPGAISGIISGAAKTSDGLRGRRADDVSGLITSGDKTFEAVAAKTGPLGQAIDLLRPFEDEVRRTAPIAVPSLNEVAATSRALSPVITNLNRNLPALNRLTKLGPQLREGFTALLGGGAGGSAGSGGGGSAGTGTGTSGVANQVLINAKPVVYSLFVIQTAIGPLNKNLDKLLAAVDPYQAEIAQAGQYLQSATSHRFNVGTNKGAPAFRVAAIFTGHPCTDPQPAAGQAQKDATC